MYVLIFLFILYTALFERFIAGIQKNKLLQKLIIIEKNNLLRNAGDRILN